VSKKNESYDMKVAIIGTGVAGLGAAWALRQKAKITLFESQARLGGHSHTVKVANAQTNQSIKVDTGFIVYNVATYPNLIALFDCLNVPTKSSDMSFAVSLDQGRYEYSGDNLRTFIGQKRNLLRLKHLQLMADTVRFMQSGEDLCNAPEEETLGVYLTQKKFSNAFIQNHILPMAAAIWSATPQAILDFPARSFGRFYNNHGLLELDVGKRPEWRTVDGGAEVYVRKILDEVKSKIVLNSDIRCIVGAVDGAQLTFADGQTAVFDRVIMAAHADETSMLLDDAHVEQKSALSSFRYSANYAYLHSDERLMPCRKHLWASWNYIGGNTQNTKNVFVTYWMNRLQGIDKSFPLFVSLNPSETPAAEKTYKSMVYHHPQFDRAAMAAQDKLRFVQGQNNIWLCGSYFGYGFHEDALASGLAVAEALGAPRPWNVKDISPAFENATPRVKNV
jgi:predicted NAD/FAD-binding protein